MLAVAKVRILCEKNDILRGKLHKNFQFVTYYKDLCRKYNKTETKTF